MSSISLNERAWNLLHGRLADAWTLGWQVSRTPHGSLVVDAGCQAAGSTSGGLVMAEVGMAGLGQAYSRMGTLKGVPWLVIETHSSRPVEACLLSQAANWPVEINQYHAMGSGPACLLNPEINTGQGLGWVEESQKAVLILEAPSLPDDSTCQALASACRVAPDNLALVVAPTSSLAGSAQIAARSVETALHRLHQLGFPVWNIVDAAGVCPLAAPAGDDLLALGRTNDLMMFASQVWLAVKEMDREDLVKWIEKVPACTTPGYGTPFLDALKQAGGFYNLDPGLFAPAEITLSSIQDGFVCHAGEISQAGLKAVLAG